MHLDSGLPGSLTQHEYSQQIERVGHSRSHSMSTYSPEHGGSYL